MAAVKEFCALFMASPPMKTIKIQVQDELNRWTEVSAKAIPMSRFEAKQKQMKDFTKHYLENIEASNTLVIQIQEGLKNGAEYKDLFELACECIACMRGDDQLRAQTKREIRSREAEHERTDRQGQA